MDACDLPTHPHRAKVWHLRGCPLRIAAAGQDQRRAVFGAVEDASGTVLWAIHHHTGGDACAAFLEQIAAQGRDGHIVLVMDTVSYHRSPAVRRWWATQAGRITPFWLPLSTPKLNPMERGWRVLKQKVACHLWANVEHLEVVASPLLDRRHAQFHTDHAPGLHLTRNLCKPA